MLACHFFFLTDAHSLALSGHTRLAHGSEVRFSLFLAFPMMNMPTEYEQRQRSETGQLCLAPPVELRRFREILMASAMQTIWKDRMMRH